MAPVFSGNSAHHGRPAGRPYGDLMTIVFYFAISNEVKVLAWTLEAAESQIGADWVLLWWCLVFPRLTFSSVLM
jgi:hypothetical protein